MIQRKPDRFERTALNWWLKDLPEIDGHILRSGAAKLLRNEHAWMRRQVQSIKKIRVDDGVLQAGIDVAVDEMMFRLAQRRK